MKNISSFEIDHTKLLPGLYVSRKDYIGSEVVTTFDLRVCRPNVDSAMSTDEIHTIEHIAATYLRNEPKWSDKVVYFGPMGCRSGFYLILAGSHASSDILSLVCDCFNYISNFTGDIPGATAEGCGNYLDMNLPLAKSRAKNYFEILSNATSEQLVYPN